MSSQQYKNLNTLTNNNNLLQQQVDSSANTDSALGSEIKNTQDTLNQHKVDKINLERTAEIKTYYAQKYKAFNHLIQVFFMVIIVCYVVSTFLGGSGNIIKLIMFAGLAYIAYSFFDIMKRDKRNFQEYDFGHPDEIEEKSSPPHKKICIRTGCDDQGDQFNKNKADTTQKTQDNMVDK